MFGMEDPPPLDPFPGWIPLAAFSTETCQIFWPHGILTNTAVVFVTLWILNHFATNSPTTRENSSLPSKIRKGRFSKYKSPCEP